MLKKRYNDVKHELSIFRLNQAVEVNFFQLFISSGFPLLPKLQGRLLGCGWRPRWLRVLAESDVIFVVLFVGFGSKAIAS